MPIYEYECRDCGHRFERIQKFSDRRVRTCPECKGRVERLLHAPAIRFKGSGWYITDYADKKSAAEKPDAKSDAADSKPDAKPAKDSDKGKKKKKES